MRRTSCLTLLTAITLSLTGLAQADNSALQCVSTHWEGDNYVFTNTCDHNIYVMYCSTDKKISGKFCGDYKGSTKGKGSYYTHTFNLKVGKTQKKWRPGSIQYGACKGMTGFGRSFSDRPDGSFACEEPRRMHDK